MRESIGDRLRLAIEGPKLYTHTIERDGFEIGYGRKGHYAAHAHLHLCDVLYAPLGLSCAAVDGRRLDGHLLLVPPRTYFGPVDTGNFFFMKFLPAAQVPHLPDKVDERLTEGTLDMRGAPATVSQPWYDPRQMRLGGIGFALGTQSLVVSLDGRPLLEITS